MLIYAAGPVDHNPHGNGWVDVLMQEMRRLTWHEPPLVYVPWLAFQAPLDGPGLPEQSERLIAVNEEALSKCDALLLRYAPGVETWGCPIEVRLALQQGIPVFLISTEEGVARVAHSVYLSAMVPADHCFTAWADLLQAINKESQMPVHVGMDMATHEDHSAVLILRSGLAGMTA